jgi:riboflavin synthase
VGEPLRPGESVAVDGACLTVAELTAGGFVADLSAETLARSTLGRLRPGRRVNVERALKVGERLGGHLVQGHVDATARVVATRPVGEFVTLRIGLPASLAPEVVGKGSIAVDGVSLTVAALGEGWFEVALVPVTLAGTTLGERRPGDEVNLETDVLAKYVRRALGADGGGRSPWEQLGRAED